MRKLLLLALGLLIIQSCEGQEKKSKIASVIPAPQQPKSFTSQLIKSSVFHNVVEITDRNKTASGMDHLFDVAIEKTDDPPVIFLQTKVPLKFLSTLYPEFENIIMITPNWTYYEEMSNQRLPEGISCAEPMASSVIYEFKRSNGELLKDSLIMNGGFPEMKFAQPLKLKDHQKAIYFEESFGSVCCQRDPQWDNKPTREEFISSFEDQHKIKIADTYKKIKGKEGEAAYYYTLSGLSPSQKLEFISKRHYSRVINRHLKNLLKTAVIYTPRIIDITDKEKIN